MLKLEVFKLDKEATLPTRATLTDAGVDLYSLTEAFIPVGKTVRVSTGVAMRIAPGFVGKVEDRSSMGAKGIRTGAGVIDAGYSGEVSVVLHNLNNTEVEREGVKGYFVSKGDKIAQVMILAVSTPEIVEADRLWISERGVKGWGSSGR